jgi:hypothetical protein
MPNLRLNKSREEIFFSSVLGNFSPDFIAERRNLPEQHLVDRFWIPLQN